MCCAKKATSAPACRRSRPALLSPSRASSGAFIVAYHPCGASGTAPSPSSGAGPISRPRLARIRGATSSHLVKTPSVRPSSPCACTTSIAIDVLGRVPAGTTARYME